MTFKSKNIEIWPKSNTVLCIMVRQPRLAAKLNRILRVFAEDTKFQKGEEPMFKIDLQDASQIESMRSSSPLLRRIFTQIGLCSP